MPRANRYLLPDHVCHVTHRCHDRSFLLRFARDSEGYRARNRISHSSTLPFFQLQAYLQPGTWCLREQEEPYSRFSGSKTACKGIKHHAKAT